MTIKAKEEVVKDLSLAISEYLSSRAEVASNLPDDIDKQIGKVISDLLPDQPSTAELMEQIQAMGGVLTEKSELQKTIQQRDTELAQVNKHLERQNAAVEHYKAKIKGMEGEKALHTKALNDASKAREKALKQLHDQHAKDLKKLEEKHQAELKKIEQKRVDEVEKYASSLESITAKNTEDFGRIAGLKDAVIRTETSVAAANSGIQSMNYTVSLVRKTQKEDGLNPRQFGQMMKVADHAVNQVSEKSEASNKAFKTQVDRLAKGVGIAAKTNNLLVEGAQIIEGSAESISKSASSLSTQTIDIANASGELKKESSELNKLPQKLTNAIENTRRAEVREIGRYTDEQISAMKNTNEQHIKDMGTITGLVRSMIEDIKKDVGTDKLDAHNKMEQRFQLLLDKFESKSEEFADISGKLKGIDPAKFSESHEKVKAITTAFSSFFREVRVEQKDITKSIVDLTNTLKGVIGEDEQ